MRKSLQVITLGCSKNTVDTERLLSRLEGVYDILPEGHAGPADVLLVNTCGFIGDAKEESIQAVLSAASRKTAGEVGRLLVFGCLSQRYMSQLPGLIPEVDGWFGARDQEPLSKPWEAARRLLRAVSGLIPVHTLTSRYPRVVTGAAPIAPYLL